MVGKNPLQTHSLCLSIFQDFDILPVKFYKVLICLKEGFIPIVLETYS